MIFERIKRKVNLIFLADKIVHFSKKKTLKILDMGEYEPDSPRNLKLLLSPQAFRTNSIKNNSNFKILIWSFIRNKSLQNEQFLKRLYL